jgi:hypothetical protein
MRWINGGLWVLGMALCGCSSTSTSTGGAAGEMGTGGSGGGSGSAGAGPVSLNCPSYCSLIATNCSGEQLQYASEGDCLATCAALLEGTLQDTQGNTLGCRLYHAGAAAGNAAVHCPHAGPLGSSVCGSPCESFCGLEANLCPGVYASPSDCSASCANFTDSASPAYSVGASGATLACRAYHLTVASREPDTHCPHTAAVSSICL